MIYNKKLITIIISLLLFSFMTLDAQTFSNYTKQRKQEIAEMQRVEKQNYNKAIKEGTVDAFKKYLKMYPKGNYVKNIKDRITDFDTWNSAKTQNTKSSYNFYLNNSKHLSFRQDAEKAIIELNSVEEWHNLKVNGSIVDIQAFMTKYEYSSCLAQARKRIHELKGVDLYNSNDYLQARIEFNEAGGRTELELSNKSKYDRCAEAYEFSNLNSYSKEKEFESFLASYPNSSKYDEVSNWLAISKAKALTMYSASYSFNDALHYAKDNTTASIVKSYIEKSKRDYSSYQKQQRKARIKANGGIVFLGIGCTDFGWGFSQDIDLFYWNVDLSMKIGNFKAPIQFEIGLKPGVTWYKDPYSSDSSYDSESDYVTSFHMPLFAKLKINICNLNKSKQSKLYICGLGLYNVVRNEALENEYSIGGGMGIAWKHLDWLTLYYRQDINNSSYIVNNVFLGTSFIYYF